MATTTKPQEFWHPIAGDSITGKFINTGNISSKFGSTVVYKIEGSSKVWLVNATKMLQNQMSQVKIGEMIKLTFKGMAIPCWGGAHPYKYTTVEKLDWVPVIPQIKFPTLVKEKKQHQSTKVSQLKLFSQKEPVVSWLLKEIDYLL